MTVSVTEGVTSTRITGGPPLRDALASDKNVHKGLCETWLGCACAGNLRAVTWPLWRSSHQASNAVLPS